MLIQDHSAYKIWDNEIKEYERRWAFERHPHEIKRPRPQASAHWLALMLLGSLRWY
ncbi:hypothetical protein SAMN05216312_10142 [Cohnella sp. OV330]|uniref:hypothetical protein n=1 Tax=Cohnella sp. OV330 TaxID=1855288 RepID=UPI0008E9A20A|nr:hypothetical protein [Cohnella sp. OV330]SFA70798.1 hypothetical protein SAMN05216312_10142 [Cohnella sp. OV330]